MNRSRKHFSTLIGLTATAAVAMHAGAAIAPADQPGLLQYPSLSPDGNTIVFAAAGDLWSIGSSGGVATRLTAHPAIEGRAKFNQDGSKLAFESNRAGTNNVFMADFKGQADSAHLSGITQVTISDRSQWLGGFSDDGQSVLFSAYLYPEIYRQPRMYSAPIDGGPITDLTGAFGRAPSPSIADDSIYFIRGYYYPHRVIYQGSGNLDIWRFDPSTKEFEQVTGFEGNDLDPNPLPDGSLVYLSSQDGNYNLYKLDAGKSDPKGRKPGRKLTDFAPTEAEQTLMGGVRDLSVSRDGSTAAFVVENTLYTLDLNNRNAMPVAVNVVLGADADRDPIKIVDASRRGSEAAMHPSGDAIAVVARNEIFVRSTADEHLSRRVTNSNTRERDIAWSPDGEVLYFVSDDEESLGSIYAATVSLSHEDIKPEEPAEEPAEDVEANEDETDAPEESTEETDASDADSESSDKESSEDAEDSENEDTIDHAARWAGALRFEINPVAVSSELVYAPMPSPDGKKLLYKQSRGDLVLHDLESDTSRVILESWSDPDVIWAADSTHVVYAVSDLNFNSDIFLLDTRLDEDGDAMKPTNLTRHPDIDHSPQLSADGKVLTFLSERDNNNWEWDVYSINLDRDLDGMRRYELDSYYSNAAKAAKDIKPLDKDEPVEIEPFEFDVDDAYLRVRRMTSTPESEGNLTMSPAGTRIAFTQGGSFVSVDQYGEEKKTVTSGSVSDAQFNLNGSAISFIHSGQAKSAKPTGGDATTYNINGKLRIESQAELAQKFDEASARFGMNFYHPTLKGLDWPALTERYKSLVMQTRTNPEFHRVMNFMFGELDGSHTGIRGGDGFSAPSANTGYLSIDWTPQFNGYRVDRIYSHGSADKMDDGLQVGDVITAIGDHNLVAGPLQSLHAALLDTNGQELLVEYLRQNEETNEFETNFGMITPISFSANSVIRYRQEVLDRQEEVDSLSDGKLGYLHIRSMGAPSVRDFERDLFAAADGKEGLIIDVRDNGGGWTTDVLLASLTAPTHAYTIPRGANPDLVQPDSYPRDRRLIYAYSRPIVVLINENSFSNAEIFAHAIRTSKRGRLVGVPTFGGVISTGSFSLIDGTTVRRPFRGWYLPDGTDMENNGAEPDVFVRQLPGDEAGGLDPQLDAAVNDLLKTIR